MRPDQAVRNYEESVPVSSMTGFARTDGAAAGFSWIWELRSVNARGLDVRLRTPPGLDRLELRLREDSHIGRM